MAHLWIEDDGGWIACRLLGKKYSLDSLASAGRPLRIDPTAIAGTVLVRAGGATPAWAVIAPTEIEVRVSGAPVMAGIRTLSDRDEIRMRGTRCFFSSESLPVVETFAGVGRPVFCGRCRQPIQAGASAVCCPGCGVWYDQSDELPCWTYADTCAFCSRATALDGGLQWTPQEES